MKIKIAVLCILLLAVTSGIAMAIGHGSSAATVPASANAAQVSTTPTQTAATSTPAAPKSASPHTQQKPAATSSTPAPTATATSTPTWRTVGNYSGDTQQMLVTLPNVQGPVRITWTCQVTTSNPQWSLTFMLTTANGNGMGSGATCQSGKTSGVTTLDVSSGGYGVTYNLYTHTGSEDVMGDWTATVQVGY